MCLEETLTVKEIFEFYGNLYNMSNNEIDRRIHEINKFLHLPNLNNFIGKIRYLILNEILKYTYFILRVT